MKLLSKYRFFPLVGLGSILLYFDYGNLSTVFFVLALLSIWKYYVDDKDKWKNKK